VAARGDVPAPAPPATEAERPAAALGTVASYLAAAVAVVRTGDDREFLARTTAACRCRSVAREGRRLSAGGGIPGFDVTVRSMREVDSLGTVASVVLVDYVIAAHVEPPTPSSPEVSVRGRRSTAEFYVQFRDGRSRVDRVLTMRTWPA
jgi:hypothetical protein